MRRKSGLRRATKSGKFKLVRLAPFVDFINIVTRYKTVGNNAAKRIIEVFLTENVPNNRSRLLTSLFKSKHNITNSASKSSSKSNDTFRIKNLFFCKIYLKRKLIKMSRSAEDILLQVRHVKHKKNEGTLYLMRERMAWMASHKSDTFSVNHKYVDIKSQKISPEGKAKVQLQIVLHQDGQCTMFHFNDPIGKY